MATNGLFTQGTTVEELMAERNKRAFAQQQQMMQQQSARSARPMETQAASLIGSSLGRALAGKMDGGAFEAKAQAKADDKRVAQARYLSASGTNSSEAMFAEVKKLQNDNHMLAAADMLAMAKKTLKEEQDAEKAAKVLADKNAKGAAEKAAEDAKDKAALEYQQQQDTQRQSNWQAEQDGKTPSKTFETFTGAQLNEAAGEGGGNYPEGSIWQKDQDGKLTWVNKTANTTSTNITLPAGYKATFDEDGTVNGMEPIAGSPAATAAAAAKDKKAGSEEGKEIHTTAVMQSLDEFSRYLEMDSLLTPILGIAGNLVSKTGASSERKNAEAALLVIQSNSGFGELQNMRDNSVTGGALGQVTEKELALLQGMLKSFSLDQTKENLVKKIKQFEELYGQTVHGKAGWETVKAKIKKEAAEKKAAEKKANKEKKGFGSSGASLKNDQPTGDLTDAQLDAQTQQMLQTSQELTQATSATYTFDPATGKMVLSQ